MKYDAVIAGYLCVDMVTAFPKTGIVASMDTLLKPGKLIEIDGLDFSLGGVVANTGLAMKKFGKQVFLNGLVGDDVMGKMVRDRLDTYHLSAGITTTGKAGTAFGIVIAPPGVDRIFLESPGCSQIFDIYVVNFEAIAQSRLFHFGYPPLLRQFYRDNGRQLLSLFSAIREMGVITSLDFSLPDPQSESGKQDWFQMMMQVLPYTDIFAPSLEEALQIMMPGEYAKLRSMAGNTDIIDHIPVNIIREMGRMIIQCGVKILIIKAGHRGIYLLTGNVSPLNRNNAVSLPEKEWNNRELWSSAYPADPDKVKNATGAGDTAIAAFLAAILDSNTPELALKYAAMAGRNNLYCHDIYEELADWQAMEEEIALEASGQLIQADELNRH